MSLPIPSFSNDSKPLSSSDFVSGSLRVTSQPWTSQKPSQPLITIPAVIGFNQSQPASRRLSIISGDVLRKWTYGNCLLPGKVYPTWHYSERRTSQQILPFIFLGPWGAVKDRNFLREHKITMLLGVRDTQCVQSRIMDGTKIAKEVGIQSVSVDVRDTSELIAAIPQAIEQINSHLQEVYEKSLDDPSHNLSFGKVLVFCESGNERSATTVAAYLMTMYGVSLVDAIQIVQTQRFCANFTDPMKELLRSFETILQAQRDVAEATALTPQQVREVQSNDRRSATRTFGSDDIRWSYTSKLKRGLDNVYDDSETDDVGTALDDERFAGRAGLAPFMDDGRLEEGIRGLLINGVRQVDGS